MVSLNPDEIKNLDRINLVACGTAYYAAEIISSYIKMFSQLDLRPSCSEFSKISMFGENSDHRNITIRRDKDTIDAIMEAKKYGSNISSMCNVIPTLARFTGNGAYLHAGPEYAVASTKVFSNMVATGLLFSFDYLQHLH